MKNKNIKVNDDGTISPIDPTKPSRYTINSKNTELADFISDPANIAKAVEGSMDKRNAVMNTGNEIDEILLKPAHWQYDDYVKAKRQIQALIEQQVLIGRIEELEKVGCCDYWEEGCSLNVCHGQQLDRITTLKAQLKDIEK
jgi:archaellum component FlaG (FlaF/FlaG flagellin family)